MLRLLLVALLAAVSARGQVQTKGRWPPTDRLAKSLAQQHAVVLPYLDNAALVREADRKTGPGPYQFAKAVEVQADLFQRGEYYEQDGVRVWTLAVKSIGAKSLGLRFGRFHLPAEGELYVISGSTHQVYGAYTAAVNNPGGAGAFQVQPIPGHAVIVQYVEPADRADVWDVPVVALEKVSHGFRAFAGAKGASGPCHVDIACPLGTNYARQSAATGIMITDAGQSYCTGVMLNNASSSGAQLFMTALHCLQEVTETSFVVGFDYKYSACRSGGAAATVDMPKTVHGMRIIATGAGSDYALYEIMEKIPASYGVFLAGWDARLSVSPSRPVCLQYPRGDPQKISYFAGQAALASAPGSSARTYWLVPMWSRGTTEKGSSGAPLFDARGLVVGHLFGGSASCGNANGNDYFGALGAEYDADSRVAGALNPEGRPVRAIGGVYLSQTGRGAARIEQAGQTPDDPHSDATYYASLNDVGGNTQLPPHSPGGFK